MYPAGPTSHPSLSMLLLLLSSAPGAGVRRVAVFTVVVAADQPQDPFPGRFRSARPYLYPPGDRGGSHICTRGTLTLFPLVIHDPFPFQSFALAVLRGCADPFGDVFDDRERHGVLVDAQPFAAAVVAVHRPAGVAEPLRAADHGP